MKLFPFIFQDIISWKIQVQLTHFYSNIYIKQFYSKKVHNNSSGPHINAENVLWLHQVSLNTLVSVCIFVTGWIFPLSYLHPTNPWGLECQGFLLLTPSSLTAVIYFRHFHLPAELIRADWRARGSVPVCTLYVSVLTSPLAHITSLG